MSPHRHWKKKREGEEGGGSSARFTQKNPIVEEGEPRLDHGEVEHGEQEEYRHEDMVRLRASGFSCRRARTGAGASRTEETIFTPLDDVLS